MRLIDLRCDWALQYAAESTQYDPADYPEVPARLPRLDGYLMGTSLAVLSCRRKPTDWARQADPWHALGEMIARHEAEFSGRLLARPDDAARWRAEPAGSLCWCVLALVGLDGLVRSDADLDRLPALFRRGVRVFGTAPGAWGRPWIERLAGLAPDGPGPRPILDLSDADGGALAAILDWFEADAGRAGRLSLLHVGDPEALGHDSVRRLRALGATIGVRPAGTAEAFRSAIESLAAVPFRGREGHEGIGVATDYLRLDEPAPELADVEKLSAWVASNFPPGVAPLLIAENARRFLLDAVGEPASTPA